MSVVHISFYSMLHTLNPESEMSNTLPIEPQKEQCRKTLGSAADLPLTAT